MTDPADRSRRPTLEEIGEVVQNPLFFSFCARITDAFQYRETIEYSSCSWEPGWNVKFKKAGKNLCTIYPRELYFTVLLVCGKKKKSPWRPFFPSAPAVLGKSIPKQRRETARSGSWWIWRRKGDLCEDIFRFLRIRRGWMPEEK